MTAPLTDRERAMCREAAKAAVREFQFGPNYRGPDTIADDIAAKLYPDPAPEPGTVTTSHGRTYRCVDGRLDLRLNDGTWWPSADYTADNVRLLASLLPKRELTYEIVRKADSAYVATPATYLTAMRAALLAVWDDIAAPAAPVPKPQWWAVVDREGKLYRASDREEARRYAASWDSPTAPYRVVALAEVPQP